MGLTPKKDSEMHDDEETPRLDAVEKQRKEDYKAYTERDLDEGWPYSDEAGTETERLSGNRPYHDEELAPVEAAALGMHIEDAPATDGVAIEDALPEEENLAQATRSTRED